ncbi:hypothetical protein PAPYR_3904 [Paratrimastix pyriformis]|uniref:Uncharacterized protein n=1 Tax=Paratrimastix pyriformis TaxID=342808 RepID=A0ABQ8UKX9_9EUKA|nr:hypothetical protein PAPYR_3904 [Paratrimastix pyriformis]
MPFKNIPVVFTANVLTLALIGQIPHFLSFLLAFIAYAAGGLSEKLNTCVLWIGLVSLLSILYGILSSFLCSPTHHLTGEKKSHRHRASEWFSWLVSSTLLGLGIASLLLLEGTKYWGTAAVAGIFSVISFPWHMFISFAGNFCLNRWATRRRESFQAVI